MINILIALLTAYVLYLIQDKVYNRIWNKNLSARITFDSKTATEGDKCSLTQVISNGKLLPLPILRVRFEVKQGLDFGDDVNISVSDKNYRSDIYTVMPYRRISRKIDFTCTKRGVYDIQSVSMISNDLLFSRRLVENTESATRLTVYPGEVDVNRLFTPFNRMMGMVLSKRYAYEDPFEMRGIRDYESYDSMRDVNWKASARTGELKVNTHNNTASPQVCILLDFDSDTEWKNMSLFEEQIRIAASVTRMLITRGVPVSIVSNGRDIATGDELYIYSGSGQSHIDIIREALARLDLDMDMKGFIPKMKAVRSEQNCQFLLLSSSYSEELQAEYNHICKSHEGSEWIVTYRSVDTPPVLSLFNGATMWEVSR